MQNLLIPTHIFGIGISLDIVIIDANCQPGQSYNVSLILVVDAKSLSRSLACLICYGIVFQSHSKFPGQGCWSPLSATVEWALPAIGPVPSTIMDGACNKTSLSWWSSYKYISPHELETPSDSSVEGQWDHNVQHLTACFTWDPLSDVHQRYWVSQDFAVLWVRHHDTYEIRL